jgi:hypothetical protein
MANLRLAGAAAVAAVLITCGGCLGGAGTSTAQGTIGLSLSPTGVAAMRVEWADGVVTVSVDPNAADITVTGTKTAQGSSTEEADARLADVTVELAPDATDPTLAVLRMSAPSTLLSNTSADVNVVLPAGLPLTVRSKSGVVAVTGNTALTDVVLDQGHISVLEQTGDVRISSSDAVIDVDSQAGNVDVTSENGNIEVRAQPAAGGYAKVVAQVGVVKIWVPAEFAAALDLSSTPVFGRVHADLDGFTVTDRSEKSYAVTATLNGGGGEVIGECDTGDLSFARLP